LWTARHNLWFAICAMYGKMDDTLKAYSTDVCVPIDNLGEMISRSSEYLDNTFAKGKYGMLGHVGDGNFHIFLPVNDKLYGNVKEVSTRISEIALELEGTCTGEHGIGLGKREILKNELGDALGTMHIIKKALDPDNRLNPGKIF